MPQEKKIDGFYKWEIEDAARTFIRAQELIAKPKLLALAKKELRKQKKVATKAVDWAANL